LKQHVWTPRRVEILVIDEADRMFDMGFIADLRFLLRGLPRPDQRQSYLSAATLSFRVLELTWEFMNNPSQITIMPQQKPAERVEQSLFHVGREEKFPLLLGLLRREGGDRILIFSNTREEARRLEDRLIRNGWETRALTGDVDQKRRLKILNDFKEGRLPILVATDVASRGLHIEAVSHVVNWDLPQDAEDYVHRIGRTARAGAGGTQSRRPRAARRRRPPRRHHRHSRPKAHPGRVAGVAVEAADGVAPDRRDRRRSRSDAGGRADPGPRACRRVGSGRVPRGPVAPLPPTPVDLGRAGR